MSQVCGLGGRRSGCQSDGVLVRALFLVCRRPPSYCFLPGCWRERGLAYFLFHRDTCSIRPGLQLMTSSNLITSSKTLSPNTVTCCGGGGKLRLQHICFSKRWFTLLQQVKMSTSMFLSYSVTITKCFQLCPWDLILFSCSVMSNSLQLHGLQYTRVPCPSLPPRACSNSWPLSWWCHPTISSSAIPFSSCPQSFPASGSFSMSRALSPSSFSVKISLGPSPEDSIN